MIDKDIRMVWLTSGGALLGDEWFRANMRALRAIAAAERAQCADECDDEGFDGAAELLRVNGEEQEAEIKP